MHKKYRDRKTLQYKYLKIKSFSQFFALSDNKVEFF